MANAPVVEPKELFEHQAGEQLMLRKFVRAAGMGIGRQDLLGRCVTELQDSAGRFCRLHTTQDRQNRNDYISLFYRAAASLFRSLSSEY